MRIIQMAFSEGAFSEELTWETMVLSLKGWGVVLVYRVGRSDVEGMVGGAKCKAEEGGGAL